MKVEREIHTTFIINLVAGRTLRLSNITEEEAEVIQMALADYYERIDGGKDWTQDSQTD